MESRSRPAGIKMKVDIDYIVDVDQEVHLICTSIVCYEDPEAKELIGKDSVEHMYAFNSILIVLITMINISSDIF